RPHPGRTPESPAPRHQPCYAGHGLGARPSPPPPPRPRPFRGERHSRTRAPAAREHVLSPKGRGEPGCASLTRATTRSPDKAKGRIRDAHPNHPRQDTSLATPGNGLGARPSPPPPLAPRPSPREAARTCAPEAREHVLPPEGRAEHPSLRLPPG